MKSKQIAVIVVAFALGIGCGFLSHLIIANEIKKRDFSSWYFQHKAAGPIAFSKKIRSSFNSFFDRYGAFPDDAYGYVDVRGLKEVDFEILPIDRKGEIITDKDGKASYHRIGSGFCVLYIGKDASHGLVSFYITVDRQSALLYYCGRCVDLNELN